MPYRDLIVPLEALPPEQREQLRPVAIPLNGLIERVGSDISSVKLEHAAMHGTTPEEKAETAKATAFARNVVHTVNSRLVKYLPYGVWGFLLIFSGKGLGLNPEQAGRVVDALIKILERAAGV